MVSRRGFARRHGRAGRNRQRLHGDQAQWLCRLGTAAARARHPLQSHRPSKRLFPAADPAELHAKGSRARGRFLARAGRGHHRRRQGAGRALRHPADFRDHHRPFLRQVDSELSRPAHAGQPMGQHHSLGAAHAHVPAHHGISLAGRPHRARQPSGSCARKCCGCWTSMPRLPKMSWPCR